MYSVSGGELSVDVTRVESKLQDIFDLGNRWKAIVLVDEADVVMSRRETAELERNAIVAGKFSLKRSFSETDFFGCFGSVAKVDRVF